MSVFSDKDALSVRIRNCLFAAGISNDEELAAYLKHNSAESIEGIGEARAAIIYAYMDREQALCFEPFSSMSKPLRKSLYSAGITSEASFREFARIGCTWEALGGIGPQLGQELDPYLEKYRTEAEACSM